MKVLNITPLDKNPVIRALGGKLCINDVTFEHSQLRESKEFLQKLGAEEALFYPEDDEEIEELHAIIILMEEQSPESSGTEALSYYLN